ncbi:MAG: MoaD/ThiS family protein [Spirochaetes bacterium]|nr:MoaD/ThiS family protein [Spirochaetota bacterium]
MEICRIRLRLFASLQKWLPDNPIDHEIVSPKTIGEFLHEKGVPEDVVAIIIRNGNRADLSTPLADGDNLEVFPLIGGG